MEVVGGLGGQAEVGERADLFGHDVDDALFVLQAADNEERGLKVDGQAHFFEKFWAYDGVREAGFVSERDEAEAFGGAGALAGDDGPSNFNLGAWFGIGELGGRADVGQAVAQQFHRMDANGERLVGEVGLHALDECHR